VLRSLKKGVLCQARLEPAFSLGSCLHHRVLCAKHSFLTMQLFRKRKTRPLPVGHGHSNPSVISSEKRAKRNLLLNAHKTKHRQILFIVSVKNSRYFCCSHRDLARRTQKSRLIKKIKLLSIVSVDLSRFFRFDAVHLRTCDAPLGQAAEQTIVDAAGK
jgi:hypothetical protein